MRRITLLIFASILLLLSLAGAAEKPRAPLPEKLLTAKTVFIDNQSGYSGPLDNCYSALVKWGRFAVVQNRDAADVVFVLTSSTGRDSGPSVILGNNIVDTSSDFHSTTLTVKSGSDVLWSDTRAWKRRGSASSDLIKELRTRMGQD